MSDTLDPSLQNRRPIFTDEASFENAFKSYYQSLYKVVYLIVKKENAAEDIVQELFVKLWQKRDSLFLNGPLSAYLRRAATNAAFDYLDKYKREVAYDSTEQFENSLSDEHTENVIAQKDLEKQIEEAVLKLPPACRNVFLLSRNEELSYKEIADTLQISIKTVENQMGKALKILRDELKPFIKGFIKIIVFYIIS